jgi:hypothetical protein
MSRFLALTISVFVFAISPSVDAQTWSQTAKLLPNDATEEFTNHFGESVAVSGNTILVGALSDNDLGSSAGAAYIFEKSSAGQWSQTAKLHASDGVAGALFGGSVSIAGNRAVITAEDAGRGAAYVFERSSAGDWNQVAELQPTALAENEHFGFAAAMNGNHIVVTSRKLDLILVPIAGTSYLTSKETGNTGAAYLFERGDNSLWAQTAVLHSPRPNTFDQFGQSVAMEGKTIAIGALDPRQISDPNLPDGTSTQGEVFMYPLVDHPDLSSPADLGPLPIGSGPPNISLANGTLAVGGTDVPPDVTIPLYREVGDAWQLSGGMHSAVWPLWSGFAYVATDGAHVIGGVARSIWTGNLVSIFGPASGDQWQEVATFSVGGSSVLSSVAIDGSIAVAAEHYNRGVFVFEAAIPEPTTTWLAITNLILMCARRRR